MYQPEECMVCAIYDGQRMRGHYQKPLNRKPILISFAWIQLRSQYGLKLRGKGSVEGGIFGRYQLGSEWLLRMLYVYETPGEQQSLIYVCRKKKG